MQWRIQTSRKCTGGCKLHKSQEEIINLMYMDDIKRIRNPNTGSEDMQWRYRDGIWHRKICHADNKKRETTINGRNRTTKSRKNQNAQRKENLQILGNIGSTHHQTRVDIRKNQKGISQENKETTRNQTI